MPVNNPASPGSDFGFRSLAFENTSCVVIADNNGDNRQKLMVTVADSVGCRIH
jgi:hypothetical protein